MSSEQKRIESRRICGPGSGNRPTIRCHWKFLESRKKLIVRKDRAEWILLPQINIDQAWVFKIYLHDGNHTNRYGRHGVFSILSRINGFSPHPLINTLTSTKLPKHCKNTVNILFGFANKMTCNLQMKASSWDSAETRSFLQSLKGRIEVFLKVAKRSSRHSWGRTLGERQWSQFHPSRWPSLPSIRHR